ncbi:M3 family metallopeptidase [Flavobacterium cyclinae]|uniref:M3 family metallopeptidase n=1 Tax=Flavobacterium cyclinae TaxID=2895947 RepID=UPI001E4D13E3|nr:M3 family metallopeptidase [Flavobacterium cyclinae]UGS20136.1 M3 family metallopeptidase [Flavobacterium cyclinae]
MKIKTILLFSAITSAITINAQDKTNMNPFFETYTTPYQVPPFHLIKNEHFKPAILEGIKKQEAEIKAIVSNKEKPTFENTILAMENSGKLLSKVSTVFYNLNSANTNEEIQAIAKELAPRLSAHNDNINLNPELFQRVKTVWDNQANLNLNKEQSKILENLYKNFVRSGANLSEENKKRLREINAEMAVATLKYGQNILAETNAYELVISDKKDLEGLPNELIEAASSEAKSRGKEGKWVFTLSNSSVMPFLQYSSNRKLRKEIWNAYQMRANQNNDKDNKELAITIANLRGERARLLGYNTHADYVLEKSMAKNPETATKLLMDLWTPALNMAKQEADDIKKMMVKDGIKGNVEPYDWRYYAEKIRKERFDLNEQEMKPYFSLDRTREGIFTVCKNLYGLQFNPLKEVPTYHEDVTVWEVKDTFENLIGILYMDFHPRASKRGGAWMTSYRTQKMENGKRVVPIVSIVCNFTKPTENAPALLTFDEVSTFFHEFGHALHGLLSNVTYESLAGTNVPRDFVELPSQIMENWAAEPEVLKMYAKHYKTGEVIPDAMIEKMQKAGTFDQGFATTEYLAAALLDMDYHTQKIMIKVDSETFENESMKKIGLTNEIIPRYRSTYFNHIFAGGYSAGYYSYIWSGVLDTDAFEVFKLNGLFNQDYAKSFRTNILEKGGTEEPMVLYKNFRGDAPSVKPLLRKRGLDQVK